MFRTSPVQNACIRSAVRRRFWRVCAGPSQVHASAVVSSQLWSGLGVEMYEIFRTSQIGVATAFLSLMMAAPLAAQYVGEIAIVQSADGTLNIRSGTSTEYHIKGVLQNGDPVVILEKSGNWVRIVEDAGSGWVYAPMLQIPSVIVMNQLVADNPEARVAQIAIGFDQFDGAALNLYMPDVTDFSALAQLDGLKSLYIADYTADDLSSLGQLTSLEALVIDEVWFPGGDYTFLSNLVALKELEIILAEFEDLSPLAELGALERLVLYRTQTHDIAPLAGLTNLVALDLSQNPLTDLTPLTQLTGLKTLELQEMTNLIDVSPLASMNGLTRLDLRGSYRVDIAPLQGHEGLEVVTHGQ